MTEKQLNTVQTDDNLLPPRNIGLHSLKHFYRRLADFDKGSTEDLSQPQHLNDLPHFGANAFDPKKNHKQRLNPAKIYKWVTLYSNLNKSTTHNIKQSCILI